MRLSAGEIGVLGVTFRTGVTGRRAGGAGALRGLPMADGSAIPKRDAAACSFRMAISSSETPGKETVSCLKLKGAEICSGAFSDGDDFLTSTIAKSLVKKLEKPPTQPAILAMI